MFEKKKNWVLNLFRILGGFGGKKKGESHEIAD